MTDYTNTHLVLETAQLKPGKVGWKSPSNLAIVKYWGKHGRQLPKNPSISFTLENSFSETTIEYGPKESQSEQIELDFFFEDQPHEQFQARIEKFFESITNIFPFLKQVKLEIRSHNSFPHSAGIASSASAMSALALCLCSMEQELFGQLKDEKEFLKKASYIARLGSGSASRSIFPEAAFWGKYGAVEQSSDLYAIPFEQELHKVFKTFKDDILIVSRKEKKVSSSAGHSLMDQNPFADVRYQQANRHIYNLISVLKTGDLDEFGQITENEALTLHALMMASNPSYILLQPGTLQVIEKVRAFRATEKLPLYFSLDAGPNPHLLYPESIEEKVNDFVENELTPHCELSYHIKDQVGKGPEKL